MQGAHNKWCTPGVFVEAHVFIQVKFRKSRLDSNNIIPGQPPWIPWNTLVHKACTYLTCDPKAMIILLLDKNGWSRVSTDLCSIPKFIWLYVKSYLKETPASQYARILTQYYIYMYNNYLGVCQVGKCSLQDLILIMD